MRARRKEARAAGWIVSGDDAALRIDDDQDADVEELRVSQVPGKGLVPSSASFGRHQTSCGGSGVFDQGDWNMLAIWVGVEARYV